MLQILRNLDKQLKVWRFGWMIQENYVYINEKKIKPTCKKYKKNM